MDREAAGPQDPDTRLNWVDEFHSILPECWFPELGRLGMSALLSGKGDPYFDVAQLCMSRAIALRDREGIQQAQRLLELAIKARTPEQISAIEQARGLAPGCSLH